MNAASVGARVGSHGVSALNSGRAHYVLIEGINLGQSIFDADQLSVVRGGSFLNKEVTEVLSREFAGSLEELSTGASSGLFKVKPDVQDVAQLCDEIKGRLQRADSEFRHLTIGVIHTQADSLPLAKAKLYAKLRRYQMRTLSISPDPATPADQSKEVIACALNGRRAALSKRKKTEAKAAFVQQRFDVGRDRKRNFYSKLLRQEWGMDREVYYALQDLKDKEITLTNDLQTLADDKAFSRLDQKIAVLYLDGNGFGKLQDRIVQNDEEQKEFDEQIQSLRRQLLAQILADMVQSGEGSEESAFIRPFIEVNNKEGQSEKQLRFETLLWGGDEMMFVVPAWMGMDLLQQVFSITSKWKIKDSKDNIHYLSHAAGLVFCHSKTPIGRMQELAKALAESVKESTWYHWQHDDEVNGRKGDYYQYVVLESLDFPSESSPKAYFKKRYGATLAESRKPLVPYLDWAHYRDEFRDLIQGLPKGQFHQLAQAIVYADDDGDTQYTKVEQLQERLFSLISTEQQQKLHRLMQMVTATAPESVPDYLEDFDDPESLIHLAPWDWPWPWLNLMILWDYLAPAYDQDARITRKEAKL